MPDSNYILTLEDSGALTLTDSNAITQSEFFRLGQGVAERTVAMKGRAYHPHNDDFIVGGMAVMFVVLVLVLFFHGSTLPYRLKAFFSNKRLYNEDGVNDSKGETPAAFLMMSIGVLCVMLMFFNDMAVEHSFDVALGIPYWIFAVGYVACMLFIHVKVLIYGVVNWVFFSSDGGRRWTSGYFFATALMALPLFLVALFDLFYPKSHDVVTACVIFIGIMYELMLICKLFVNFNTKEYGYLPLILYFCSVELMPAVVIWYTFDWINNNFIVKNLIY